jgi:phosphomannomutase
MSSTSESDAALREQARAWLRADPDPATRAELQQLLDGDDAEALAARFARPLTFGTAGLRGVLGAGPARMNRVVVRRTSAGLASWIYAHGEAGDGLVVGRDARHGSAEFAADVAATASRFGVKVMAFRRALPTPLTAFAVKQTGAAAGVMITASHNPPRYNGYKVFVADGSQIIPPADAEVAAAAETTTLVPIAPSDRAPAASTYPFGDDDEKLLDAYRRMALGLIDPSGPRDVRIVYTAMHGVGGAVLSGLLAAAGFTDVVKVAEQFEPDPDFPTVTFPNPEEPGALDLALATARHSGADVVLANDPDADRLAVAVPDRSGAWRTLTGDEVGILLADHLLSRGSGSDRLVTTTFVSSRMLQVLAARVGVAYEETPTGFKWIARTGSRHPGYRLVLGYEEALGYAASEAVADKDGLTAGLLMAELAALDRARGRSLLDHLDELHAQLGVHLTRQRSIRADGAEWSSPEAGMAALTGLVSGWRKQPPTTFTGHAVTALTDLADGYEGYPAENGLIFELDGGDRVILRLSGTEPKLKLYVEAVTPPPGTNDLAAARARAAADLDAIQAELTQTLDSKLRRAIG